MLQVAICDDDIKELQQTRALMEAWLREHPALDGSLRVFQSGYDLTEYVRMGGAFDLYLLDVLMPRQDGIALGHIIRQHDDRAAIIYLTSSTAHAVQSYGVRAFNYLLKPIDAPQLCAALDEFCQGYLREQTALFPVRTREGVVPVRMMELVSAELRSHTVNCCMADGSKIVSQTLRGSFDQFIGPLLQDRRFLKVGASYAVNLSFVSALSGREFLLKNGNSVRIPRSALSEIRDAYISYLFERGLG